MQRRIVLPLGLGHHLANKPVASSFFSGLGPRGDESGLGAPATGSRQCSAPEQVPHISHYMQAGGRHNRAALENGKRLPPLPPHGPGRHCRAARVLAPHPPQHDVSPFLRPFFRHRPDAETGIQPRDDATAFGDSRSETSELNPCRPVAEQIQGSAYLWPACRFGLWSKLYHHARDLPLAIKIDHTFDELDGNRLIEAQANDPADVRDCDLREARSRAFG
jgi:hypothetical protein